MIRSVITIALNINLILGIRVENILTMVILIIFIKGCPQPPKKKNDEHANVVASYDHGDVFMVLWHVIYFYCW